MKIALFLHFYQPFNQQLDILDRIVHECYLPVTRQLINNPKARLTINLNAALTEMLWENGYQEVVENIRKLLIRGQIEITSSAKYHAFLPLLPETEIKRQIKINNETNRRLLGDAYHPVGFFSPELAVNQKVLKEVREAGYQWMSVPQISHKEGSPEFNKLYLDEETGVKLMFRNKRISSLILSGVCHDSKDFIKETSDLHEDAYWYAVMDAETFGHHRVGHDKFLFDILTDPFFEPVTVSEVLQLPLDTEASTVRPSTWTNEEQDFWLDREENQDEREKVYTTAKSFILWKDPDNPIHKLQWELTELALENVTGYENHEDERYIKARDLLDKAIASDQFWWASAKPWWSLEMIEQGAFALKNVLITLNASLQSVQKAEKLYQDILSRAFEWQRSGYIRKKHLENSSTYMKEPFKKRTPPEWYNQIVLEFEDEMKNAAQRRDFEKAIKWRDALIKINNETDIFDVLHVVDELWTARNIPQVKPFLLHKNEELSDFSKEYLLPLD